MPYVNLFSLSSPPCSFILSSVQRPSLSWSSVAVVSRELPIFLGGITGSSNGRVGMSMGGREAGPQEEAEEGRDRRAGGDSERWAVVQSVSPSLLRASVLPSHPLSLFLGCFHRRYSYQCYVD